MRKKRKDLADPVIRKIIYMDDNNEYIELPENSRKYLNKQYKERNIRNDRYRFR